MQFQTQKEKKICYIIRHEEIQAIWVGILIELGR